LSRKHLYVPAFYAGINIDIDFSFRTLEAAKKSLAEGNHQQFQTYQNSFQQYLTALKKKFSFAEENPDIISVPEATQKRFAELVQAIYELEASNPKALSGTTPLLNKQG
jgi:hypothetical protein